MACLELILQRPRSCYKLTINGREITVRPLYSSGFSASNTTVAASLQTLATSQLLIHPGASPFEVVSTYFEQKNWEVVVSECTGNAT